MLKKPLLCLVAAVLLGCQPETFPSNVGNNSGQNTDNTGNPSPNVTLPTAAFSTSVNGRTVTVNAGQSRSGSSNSSMIYTWNFNNESTATGQNISHVFNSDGNKFITLVVQQGNLTSASVTKNVTINTPNIAPVANFTSTLQGLTVSLDGSISSDANGDNLTYVWDINGEQTLNGVKVSYTFNTEGTKQISLTVNDGKTNSATVRKSLTINNNVNQVPIARFTAQVSDLVVMLDASSSSDADNDNLTYRWNLNNETSSTQKTFSHTFASAGDKLITLTVNDGKADSSLTSKTITLTAPDKPEPEYDVALAAITPRVKTVCLFCHGTSPASGATITYGTASTPEEVEQAIMDYLTANPNNVDRVKGMPTSISTHPGLNPFSSDPDKSNWLATVEGVVQKLSGPNLGTGEIIFTEDYEDKTVGENPAGWGVNYQYNIATNPSATEYSNVIKVTNAVAHTGTKALYVNGNDLSSAMRYSFKPITLPGGVERLFVRYYVRSTQYIGNRATNPNGSQPNHNDFMALDNGQGKEVRIGEIKGALGVNEFGNDDIVPKAEYWYGQIQTPRLEANTWYCIETAFLNDGVKPELKTWLNDELITHIDDESDFKNGSAIERWLDDRFGKVNFGWANYGTYDTEIYFDDIVASTERIGCL